MSIVRIGLAETKKFAEGWDAIFGKSPSKRASATKKAKKAKGAAARKKGARKK